MSSFKIKLLKALATTNTLPPPPLLHRTQKNNVEVRLDQLTPSKQY